MLGKFALNGYTRFIDKGNSCCDREDGYYGNGIDDCKIGRVTSWINLLRHMECKVTPDVVATYLLATRQYSLLRPFINSFYSYSKEIVQTWSPSGYNSCLMSFWDSNNRGAASEQEWKDRAVFPPELYRMANNYLRNRLGDFIDATTSVVRDANVGTIAIGTRIPKHVYNSLKGFNPVVGGSTNNAIMSIKMLNSTLIPTAVSSFSSRSQDINKYPSLKWDPTSSFTSAGGTDEDWDNFSVDADASTVSAFDRLINIVSTLSCYLTRSVKEDKEAPLFKDSLEALCYGLECILYIACTRRGCCGTVALNLPEMISANKFYFKDKVDEKGAIIFKGNRGMYSPYYRDITNLASVLKNISPEAAICLGNVIGDYALCHASSSFWRDATTRSFFDKICKVNDGAVTTFLLHEAVFARDQKWIISERIRALRGEDKHCCGGDECCGR